MNINITVPTFKDKDYNIVDYGAIEGGIFNNREAINKAIEECNLNGGGRVIIPSGMWLTGPIELKSNVCLYLEDTSYVYFSKSKEEYPLYVSDWEGITRIRAKSPISAVGCENIGICGNGILDGSGHLWRGVKKWKLTQREWDRNVKKSPYVQQMKETDVWYPTKTAYEGAIKGEVLDINEASLHYDLYRPVFVSIKNCNNILLDGVTFQNSPAWNIHPLFTTNLTVRNCIIKNPYHAQNGDGIDVESCSNIEIHHCRFEVGDDGICIKSGKNKEARQIKAPCTNVHIHDCVVYEAHGGFVVGSEMSRGVNNILVERCNFIGTDIGIRFKSALGRGGVISDILIKDIKMMDIKEEAIIFTMGYKLTTLGKDGFEEKIFESEDDIPVMKDINIKDTICVNSKKGLVVEGINHYSMHDISLENVDIVCDEDINISNAANIKLNNVRFIVNNKEEIYNNQVITKGE